MAVRAALVLLLIAGGLYWFGRDLPTGGLGTLAIGSAVIVVGSLAHARRLRRKHGF